MAKRKLRKNSSLKFTNGKDGVKIITLDGAVIDGKIFESTEVFCLDLKPIRILQSQ